MSRRGPIMRDIATGFATVVVATAARGVILRRLGDAVPVLGRRRVRRREQARVRAAGRWVRDNPDLTRELVATSEGASAQLSIWDNARRTSDAFLDAAQVVAASLASGGADTAGALRRKLDDLNADAAPHLQAATTAQSSAADLQERLRDQVQLLAAAPPDVVSIARRLVTAHDAARRTGTGRLDEVAARRRLDALSALRETLGSTLARLASAPD